MLSKPLTDGDTFLGGRTAVVEAEDTVRGTGLQLAALPDSGGDARIFASVLDALADDLNLPAALGALFTVVHRGPEEGEETAFERAIFALGLKLDVPESPKPEAPAAITKLAEERSAARKARDFKTADALRGEIHAAGWEMHDQKDGYSVEPDEKMSLKSGSLADGLIEAIWSGFTTSDGPSSR